MHIYFQKNKAMIRWFRGRKHKRKCNDSSDESSTEYGFKDSKSRETSPYGFKKTEENCVQIADIVPNEITKSTNDYNLSTTSRQGSTTPHIYDEIKDLPEHIIASQFRILTGLKFSSSQAYDDEEGPYMVVPVLPARRIPAKNSAITCVLPNETSRSRNDLPNKPSASNNNASDSSKEILYAELQESSLKSRAYESVDLLHCSSNDSVALPIRISSETDNVSEYDLNSSGASTEGEYPVFLDKIEQNLFLKEQVREIIRSLSREDSEYSVCHRTDSFSTESSAISSVPNSSSSEVSDPGVFADQSESEDENEYHECTKEMMDVTNESDADLKPEVKTSEGDSDLKNSVQKYKKRSSKARKPKFKIYSVQDKDHEHKLQSVIQEDMEMYLLPSCQKETDYYDYKTCRKPVLVPTLPTRIYQDPNRLKSNKNNKLLGDLIRMNYDKQHLILV